MLFLKSFGKKEIFCDILIVIFMSRCESVCESVCDYGARPNHMVHWCVVEGRDAAHRLSLFFVFMMVSSVFVTCYNVLSLNMSHYVKVFGV